MRATIFALALAAAPLARAAEPAPEPAQTPEEKKEIRVGSEKDFVEETETVRLSLPMQEDKDAWEEPGLRIQLGLGKSQWWGRGNAADLESTAALLNARVRLNPQWSLGATFQYEFLSTGFLGLRWAALVEPQFHLARELSLSVGLGYGGIAGSRELTPDDMKQFFEATKDDQGSRTVGPDATLWRCEGGAWVSQARLQYLWVAGPLFATGPFASAGAQWTQCKQSLGRIDNETGVPMEVTQWWLHGGGTLGWWFAWR